MDAKRTVALPLLLRASFTTFAVAQDEPSDEVTRQIFKQYLSGSKVDSDSIKAAIHLVAVRGRRNGFWKEVLAELQTTDRRKAEINYVTVLGKMLGYDANSRRIMKTGERTALIPSVHLGPEVVDVLLERGLQADRHMMDHYIIALAQADTPKAKEFFLSLLQADEDAAKDDSFGNTVQASQGRPPRPMPSPVFHAAVGLAQLGESEGIGWLVKHADQIHVNSSDVEHAIPSGVEWRQRRMGLCCIAALQQIFHNHKLKTDADWKSRRKTVDQKSQPRHGVSWRES